jgi:hypothetical protein
MGEHHSGFGPLFKRALSAIYRRICSNWIRKPEITSSFWQKNLPIFFRQTESGLFVRKIKDQAAETSLLLLFGFEPDLLLPASHYRKE